MLRSATAVVILITALGAHCAAARQPSGPTTFNALIDAQTQRAIDNDPELQTLLGVRREGDADQSGQLTDVSLPRRALLRDELQANLEEIRAWDRSKLAGQERWTYDLMSWFYTTQIDLMSFDWSPAWLPAGASNYAVDQLFSIPATLQQFMENFHPVVDPVSASKYIARLRAIEGKLDQVRANFDLQAEHGVLPPRVALEGAANQIRTLLQPEPEASLFVRALQTKLDQLPGMDEAQRAALVAEAAKAVAEATNPGYARLLSRLEQAMAAQPHSRGLWAAPNGDAFYQAALRWNTSTNLSAEEIHRIGLREVARIEKEMNALLVAQGLRKGSAGERMAALTRDPRFLYEDSDAGRSALIADIQRILTELEPRIPQYFGRVPAQRLEVRRVPLHTEATAPGGYYFPPAMDGSRPGVFFINLGDIEANNRWSLPTLTYHEGAPGHHFQISLGQTLEGLPLLRRTLNPSAFTEGWALYAEQLVAEMGVYDQDPWGQLGRLRAEMFRSVRLVVDTGLHHKRWTPERAIDYMRRTTGMTLPEVRAEVHRYLVQPGQACSYKIGHLKIVELRERAKQRLGGKFDIRSFHDVVLGNGALPLLVLEQVIDDWIESLLREDAHAAGTASASIAVQARERA